MCGVCGIVLPVPAEPGALAPRVAAMVRALAHRGPDDQGVFADGPVALGHARLSILDLSPTGHQPMLDPAGQVALAYNGEIYNHLELREELERAGHSFRGRSDTEVVLQGYLRWGIEVLSRLQGMYALALWDGRTGTLHLARDPLGIKPLYYEDRGSELLFASEIKALLAGRPGRRAVDPRALHEYLWFGNVHEERTLYGSIRRLRPGHRLEHQGERARVVEFWSPRGIPPRSLVFEEAVQGVRTRLEEAVRSHLVSDVPVGVFLSGGVDSSAVVALASRHYGGRLATWSAAFEMADAPDELPKAALVARTFATDHHELRVGLHDLPDLVRRVLRCHDEPFADPADLPLYLLSEQVGGRAKVVLQGDGGDEVFGGYGRYVRLRRLRAWRAASMGRPLVAALSRRRPAAGDLLRVLDAMASPPGDRMALTLSSESRRRPPTRLLAPGVREAVAATEPFAAYRVRASWFAGMDAPQQMLLTDLSLRLPDRFLEKVDRPTMAFGVEVRVPFLHLPLVEFAAGLPSEVKLRGGRKKSLLRAALRGVVPDDILDGPKVGLDVPVSAWLRGPLAGFAREAFAGAGGLLDGEALDLLERHGKGEADHGDLLWKALMLALWQQEYDVGLG